jgi:hypothetical protein
MNLYFYFNFKNQINDPNHPSNALFKCFSLLLLFFYFYYFFIGVTSQNAIEKWVMNFQTSQIEVFKFLNVSIKGNPLWFVVKSCQNSKYPYFFLEKKNKKLLEFRC